MVKNIRVGEDLPGYFTNDDGTILYSKIVQAFKENKDVVISFEGISGINSSFVNSAFIELLDDYSFDYIRRHLLFKDTTKQINRLIKDRFKYETSERIHA